MVRTVRCITQPAGGPRRPSLPHCVAARPQQGQCVPQPPRGPPRGLAVLRPAGRDVVSRRTGTAGAVLLLTTPLSCQCVAPRVPEMVVFFSSVIVFKDSAIKTVTRGPDLHAQQWCRSAIQQILSFPPCSSRLRKTLLVTHLSRINSCGVEGTEETYFQGHQNWCPWKTRKGWRDVGPPPPTGLGVGRGLDPLAALLTPGGLKVGGGHFLTNFSLKKGSLS